MARSVGSILVLTFVLSFVRSDEKTHFEEEHERRWNTPPELTPESTIEISAHGKPQARFLSPIPVTASISLTTGQNNAHSLSLGANLQGISLSESNSYNEPARTDGSSISVSKSTTLSAGLSGLSTAGAEAYSDGGNAETNSHSLSFGQASAASYGVVENGKAFTGAASSVGTSPFSATNGDNLAQSSSQASAISVQNRNRPTWDNVGPSYERDDRRFLSRPTLTVLKPHGRVPGPATLNIGAYDASRKPTIHIYKWRPGQTIRPRPSLSIEHHELRPHDSRNDQVRGSTGLQIGVSSSSSTYGSSASGSTAGHRGGSSMVQVIDDGSTFVRFPERGSVESQYTKGRAMSKQSESDIFSDLVDSVGELLDIV